MKRYGSWKTALNSWRHRTDLQQMKTALRRCESVEALYKERLCMGPDRNLV